MFSAEDVQEILRLLPPEEIFQKNQHTDGTRLPPLLRTPSGTGLLTQNQVSQDFEDAVFDATHRIPVSVLAEGLDVEPQVVLQFVQDNPALALLSANNSDIVPENESRKIKESLHNLIDCHVLSKASFAQKNDVSLESIDRLIQMWIEEGVVSKTDDHIMAKRLERDMDQSISDQLEEAYKESVSVELTPSKLPGEPPVWLIVQKLNERLETDNSLLSLFFIEKSTSAVCCIPKKFIAQKVDDEVARLATGETPYLDLKQFSNDHYWHFASWTDARDYLSSHPVRLHDTIAVSQPWISHIVDRSLQALLTAGHVDLTSSIRSSIPSECLVAIVDGIEEQLTNAYEQTMALSDSSHPLALYRVGDFLITQALYTIESDFLLEKVGAYVTDEWNKDQEKEWKFQMSDFVTRIPVERTLARTLCTENKHGLVSSLEESFTRQLVELETEADLQFSQFWADRIVSRVPCYTEGLHAVEDQKLRDQLSDLLSTYVAKELLPDTIAKARSSGFVRGKKTRKNIQKLESTLNATPSLQDLTTAIDKFSKKQGVHNPDDAGLARLKESLMEDMVRKMQKYSDGPLLFLTLVIVLRAKHRAGVVYATGKFAPRLLKQLKSTLSAEQYENLEKYKDHAKAGSLSVQDKEDMKNMATVCIQKVEEHV